MSPLFQILSHSNILPLVVVYPEAVVYGPVKTSDVRYLVEEHLYKGRIVNDLLAPPKQLTGQIGSLRSHKGYNPAEQRIVLERAGIIDPDNIEEFITSNGYEALGKVLSEMKPENVIDVIEKSGLARTRRRRLPHRTQMAFCARSKGREKICRLQRR